MMKPNIKLFAIVSAFLVSSVVFSKQSSAQQSNVSFQIFYDQLSPFGQWVNYADLGYVWVPNAGADFAPYSTQGHWIMTDYGWTWVSDYSWGWAPFHYGRWNYDNSYGWLWVPGNEWGPSWVTWRRSNGYYGWAPLESGISVNVSFGRAYNNNYDHWNFVRDRDLESSDIHNHYVNRIDHDRIIRNSTVINRTYIDSHRNSTYPSGPAREDVQKITGRTINSVKIQENNKPGQVMNNGQLMIYRPIVKMNIDKGPKPTPSNPVRLQDVKRPGERNTLSQPLKSTPITTNGRGQQQNTIKPQNNNVRVQPAQIQKPAPTNTNVRGQQQNTVKPQNNNTVKAPPTQPQKPTPTNTNVRGQQQNNVKPQNNNAIKVQSAQPPKQTPANTGGRSPQQNTVNSQNNNNKVQPTPPPKPTPSNNNVRSQPQNTVHPQNNNNPKPQPSQPRNPIPSENHKK